MRKPPDFTTERYLRDLRAEARAKRLPVAPVLEPEPPVLDPGPKAVVDRPLP